MITNARVAWLLKTASKGAFRLILTKNRQVLTDSDLYFIVASIATLHGVERTSRRALAALELLR